MAGKGTADTSFTIDRGNAVPISGTPHTCDPVYGQAVLSTTLKKVAQSETVSLLGVGCHHISASGKDTISGGFGIENGATNGAVGWGTFSGTFDQTSLTFSLKLKGSITQ